MKACVSKKDVFFVYSKLLSEFQLFPGYFTPGFFDPVEWLSQRITPDNAYWTILDRVIYDPADWAAEARAQIQARGKFEGMDDEFISAYFDLLFCVTICSIAFELNGLYPGDLLDFVNDHIEDEVENERFMSILSAIDAVIAFNDPNAGLD